MPFIASVYSAEEKKNEGEIDGICRMPKCNFI